MWHGLSSGPRLTYQMHINKCVYAQRMSIRLPLQPLQAHVSLIMQQGDCNAPATFQCLMTLIFRDIIGRFMHVYLNNIFIYSNTIEEHEQHLKVIFDRLRVNTLYLKWSKCELYVKCIDCLSHMIDDRRIHPDVDKLTQIQEWKTA
jgi:hypothetical protein